MCSSPPEIFLPAVSNLSSELETCIRVASCVILVASDEKRYLSFRINKSVILDNLELLLNDDRIPLASTSSFFRCLAYILSLCEEPRINMQTKEYILRVVFMLSLLRLYSLQPITSLDDNRAKKQNEIQSIAVMMKLSLRILRSHDHSLLYCFYGSLLLKAPFDTVILQKTFFRELNLKFKKYSVFESLLPLQKINSSLITLERYFHSPGSQDISDIKSHIIRTVNTTT
jgi:hypothetical protein